MKTQLLLVIFAILIGLTISCPQKESNNASDDKLIEYVTKNWRNFIIKQGIDANRTNWGFDISKSTLKDDTKSLVATVPVSVGGVTSVLEYQFHLAKCGGPSTDLPRRGRVSINGQRASPLSFSCSRFDSEEEHNPFNEQYPRGGNIHQNYASIYDGQANSKNIPIGFDISFDTVYSALKKANSSSGYYHLDTKLRVLCSKGVQENQKVGTFQFFSSSRYVYVTLTHYSEAACPIALPQGHGNIIAAFILLFVLVFGACFTIITNLCVICGPIIMFLCLCCCCCGLLCLCCCCCCFCGAHSHHKCGGCHKQENQVLPQYSINVPPELANIQQPVPPAQYLVAQPMQAVQPVQQIAPTPVHPEKKEERKVQQVNVTAAPQQQFIEMQQVVLPAPQPTQPVYYYDPRLMTVAYPQQ